MARRRTVPIGTSVVLSCSILGPLKLPIEQPACGPINRCQTLQELAEGQCPLWGWIGTLSVVPAL